jgi:hypothetical protein
MHISHDWFQVPPAPSKVHLPWLFRAYSTNTPSTHVTAVRKYIYKNWGSHGTKHQIMAIPVVAMFSSSYGHQDYIGLKNVDGEGSCSQIFWQLHSVNSQEIMTRVHVALSEMNTHHLRYLPRYSGCDKTKKKLNSMVWVRERTIPTEQPPLVGDVIANFCG